MVRALLRVCMNSQILQEQVGLVRFSVVVGDQGLTGLCGLFLQKHVGVVRVSVGPRYDNQSISKCGWEWSYSESFWRRVWERPDFF